MIRSPFKETTLTSAFSAIRLNLNKQKDLHRSYYRARVFVNTKLCFTKSFDKLILKGFRLVVRWLLTAQRGFADPYCKHREPVTKQREKPKSDHFMSKK